MRALHTAATAAVLLPVLAPCTAQTISTTLTALTPLTVQATSGTQVATATQPAGPLLPEAGIGCSPAPGVSASVNWSGQPAAGIVYLVNNVLSNVTGPPASGTAGPHEILITFTLSMTAQAVVEVHRSTIVSPGQPWPTVAIDVGNDGTIDLANVQSTVVGPLTIGPQPVLLRVILAAQLVSNGLSGTSLEFRLQPSNNLSIVQTAIGCAPANLNYDPLLGPSFTGTGIGAVLPPSPDLRAFVFGFTQQPLLLPPVLGQTCLLVPAPDVLIVTPPAFWVGVGVPLPAAVRPATFHVQAIGLSPTLGLATGDGFTVHAF